MEHSQLPVPMGFYTFGIRTVSSVLNLQQTLDLLFHQQLSTEMGITLRMLSAMTGPKAMNTINLARKTL